MRTRFTLRCIQSGEKCSFISLLAPYPFNKYTFLIKILSSLVKVILFIYITTVVCQVVWLPRKSCSCRPTKLFELNQSATEWRCLVWHIIMGELMLIILCRPALECSFCWDTVYVRLSVCSLRPKTMRSSVLVSVVLVAMATSDVTKFDGQNVSELSISSEQYENLHSKLTEVNLQLQQLKNVVDKLPSISQPASRLIGTSVTVVMVRFHV